MDTPKNTKCQEQLKFLPSYCHSPPCGSEVDHFHIHCQPGHALILWQKTLVLYTTGVDRKPQLNRRKPMWTYDTNALRIVAVGGRPNKSILMAYRIRRTSILITKSGIKGGDDAIGCLRNPRFYPILGKGKWPPHTKREFYNLKRVSRYATEILATHSPAYRPTEERTPGHKTLLECYGQKYKTEPP